MLFTAISNKRGSALMIGLIITIVLSLMMTVLLEKVIPMSRQVRGIENATLAAYQAESAIEKALDGIRIKNPGNISISPNVLSSTGAPSNTFQATLTGNLIPLPGQGNSEYSRDWNRISPGKPVQLILPAGTEIKALEIDFRVPAMDPNPLFNVLDNSLGSNSGVINWTLSQRGTGTGVLIADMNTDQTTKPSLFQKQHINFFPTTTSSRLYTFYTRSANESFSGTVGGVSQGYESVLNNCIGSGCTLKLSLITSLKNGGGQKIPYLEYQIRNVNGSGQPLSTFIPLQYATITAEGMAYGFKQTRLKNIQQLTTSEALDFAVFQ